MSILLNRIRRVLLAILVIVLSASSVPVAEGDSVAIGRPFTIRSVVTSAGLPGVILLEGGWLTETGILAQRSQLLLSANSGATWVLVGTPPTLAATIASGDYAVAVARRADPTQPVRVLYADHDQGLVYRSGDNGSTWATYTFALLPDCYHSYSVVMASVQSDPERLLARYSCMVSETWIFGERPSGSKVYGLNEAYFVSVDGGVSWQQTSPVFSGVGSGDPGAPTPDGRWLPAPADPDLLYAYREYGWSMSMDGGTTWATLTGSNLSGGELVVTGVDSQRLYLYQFQDPVSHHDPVLVAQRSSDGGATWADLTLPTCRVPESRLAASNVRIGALALSCGGVLYTSQNDGATWDRRAEVPPSESGAVQTPVELIADTGGLDRVLIPRTGVLFALDFAGGPLQEWPLARQYPSYLPQLQR